MKLYLDSADIRAWTLPAGCPPVQGVTTNPSLLHQAGLPVTLATGERLLKAAGDQGLAELMLQLPVPDPAQALHWQSQLQAVAQQAGVPPYVVFHDSVLRDMAATRPQSLPELGQIGGIGDRKLAAYGEAFLAIIRQH